MHTFLILSKYNITQSQAKSLNKSNAETVVEDFKKTLEQLQSHNALVLPVIYTRCIFLLFCIFV